MYVSDDRTTEEIREQIHRVGASFTWQVILLARSLVQYSDSRGSVLSRFHLPCEPSEGHVQSGEPGDNQHVTLQTESVSVVSTPHLAGRASAVSHKPNRVLSLFELASRSASRAAQTVSSFWSHVLLFLAALTVYGLSWGRNV